jgi:hypothetical protein
MLPPVAGYRRVPKSRKGANKVIEVITGKLFAISLSVGRLTPFYAKPYQLADWLPFALWFVAHPCIVLAKSRTKGNNAYLTKRAIARTFHRNSALLTS